VIIAFFFVDLNQIIRLTKIFYFEMAHPLYNYNGPCKNIHGHSYKLHVTIKGYPKQELDDPEDGLLVDFKWLKKIINEEIVNRLDHALVLNERKERSIQGDQNYYGNEIFIDYQPTCENILNDFSTRIKNRLPDNISLQALTLYETANSFGEWVSDDN
jgi:6-pyruvoyltetrahydropterin/6-carboxytetrahydropterin synthase